jgi:hypothetical protein
MPGTYDTRLSTKNMMFHNLIPVLNSTFVEIKGDMKARHRGRRMPQGMSVFRSLSNWKPEGKLLLLVV